MTNEPTNTDRAAWAREALAVFTARTCSGDHPDTMDRDDFDCAIGDLITDLLHLATQEGFDAGAIVRHAFGNFGVELLDETAGHRKAVPELREALAWLATAAEDMDAAIDDVTDRFDSERMDLHCACLRARQVLDESATRQTIGSHAELDHKED